MRTHGPPRRAPPHGRGLRARVELRREGRRPSPTRHGRCLSGRAAGPRRRGDPGFDPGAGGVTPQRSRGSEELARRGRGGVRIEGDERQLGAVVRGREAPGPPDPLAEVAGQPRRLVDVAVQRDRGLAGLDEAADRDASDVDVERRRGRRSGRRGPRGRGASRTAASGRGRRRARDRLAGQDARGPRRSSPRRASRSSHGTLSASLLRRDAARVDESRHVVALAVLQQEGRGRDEGVAEDRARVPLVRAAVRATSGVPRGRPRRTGRPPRPGRRCPG